ncbi:Protein ECERIFERUM 1 [Ananas comosus]|uniref:aldehyde oxygenase (deformylating) n=1 Tax=Ananas comosus TaxID=4615 RepID=A0A199UIT5_ANACO|nr:Protein ECERIFERUM 1 [Ananas comosus]
MASKPGPFTEWPWQRLGNFKYVVLAPWVLHGLRMVATKGWRELDVITYNAIFPSLLLRMIHNQIWITLSRFQNARSKHQIVDRSIEFEQVDRERNWDDQIIFNGLLLYVGFTFIPSSAQRLPMWRTDGAVMIALLHAGPVEFLYYWFHRALHHHFLYSRYHSHHHASIVTEPITSVIHPFAEHVVYYALFTIPMLTTVLTGRGSIIALLAYTTYLDFMNNMGHCNFELFRTNYSLFMPFYDYIYGTMDKSSDDLYESSLKGKEEAPDVVHLTHPTTLQSIYHLRLGFASLASRPYNSKWYMLIMWPISSVSMLLTWIYGSSFTVERNTLKKLKLQTWAIPRYNFQYGLKWEKEAINDLIEKAILEADQRGVRAKELNGSGELYIEKHPKLRVRIVDGSSLAAAVVLKSIPAGTNEVLLAGNLSKVARAVAAALCQKGVQVIMTRKHEFKMLKGQMTEKAANYLVFSRNYTTKVWLVGDGLEHEEQKRAPKGARLIPYSQFPPKKIRNDCSYYTTPCMKIPETLQNMHSCENWLPRRVMSAWRAAGIVHALEGWDVHECGETVQDVEKTWSAAIRHGFLPVTQI